MTVQSLTAVSFQDSNPVELVPMTDEAEALRYEQRNNKREGLDSDEYDELDRDAFGGVFG